MSAAPSNAPDIVVTHDVAAHRFEATVNGHLALADYELDGARMVFTHTFVPPELRGRGIAGKLVRSALEWARAEQRTVVPACSYVTTFIQRHAEYQPLLA